MDGLDFFKRGVTEQFKDAFERSRQIIDLQKQFYQTLKKTKRSAMQFILVDNLFIHPTLTAARAAKLLQVTPRAVQNNINKLVDEGILTEVTDASRYRVYIAEQILDIVNKPLLLN